MATFAASFSAGRNRARKARSDLQPADHGVIVYAAEATAEVARGTGNSFDRLSSENRDGARIEHRCTTRRTSWRAPIRCVIDL